MDVIYQSHIDRELESLIERIYPPRVCIDNNSYEDCTVVKVDSANRHGILLEMVQVLIDLDLVISKSYVSSDGGWFMDVFHVTDQFGNKITDNSLVRYIQQALCATRTGEISKEKLELHTDQGPQNASTQKTALELTGPDQVGLLSEISAALVDLGCNITSATAWTHNHNMACIIYVEDGSQSGPISDPIRLALVEQQLGHVVDAHEGRGEKRCVRLTASASAGTHSERRLHQLMYADGDYESSRACNGDRSGDHKKGCDGTHVSISRCEDKQYWVVNVRSRDRPKLLFDTVCVLTDMQYVVFHASIRSSGSMADQEYFIRHEERPILERESERQKLTLCLIAAIERRVCQGLRVELQTENRKGLLSDVTRAFRENGLSIARVEIGIKGNKAVGSFYVTDSSGEDVNPSVVDVVREETGGSMVAVPKSPYRTPPQGSSDRRIADESTSGIEGHSPRFSLGSMLWSRLERLSSSFGLIRS